MNAHSCEHLILHVCQTLPLPLEIHPPPPPLKGTGLIPGPTSGGDSPHLIEIPQILDSAVSRALPIQGNTPQI